MTLASSVGALEVAWHSLEQSWSDLLWAVVQGQPETEEGHVVADHFEMATNDVLLLTQLARYSMVDKRGPIGLLDMQRTLVACQEHFNQLSAAFYSDLCAPRWISALNTLASDPEMGETWFPWVQGVQEALGHCPEALYEVGRVQFEGWKDLTERMMLVALSTQGQGLPHSLLAEQG